MEFDALQDSQNNSQLNDSYVKLYANKPRA